MPTPDASPKDILALAVQHYFLPSELTFAQQLLSTGSSYEQAITSLVKKAVEALRNSNDVMPHVSALWFVTLPSGKVLIYRPGHGFPERPLYELQASYLASLAIPAPDGNEPCRRSRSENGLQLSFFEDVSGVEPAGEPQEVEKAKKTRKARLSYVPQPIIKGHGQEVQGWVVKDRGLGYYISPRHEGYSCHIVHLGSRREMAVVLLRDLDHERIREWVSACVMLTDWNRGIQAILAEKRGKQKQLAWSRQLEALWQEQRQVKRQLTFF